jgi:DNA-binding CsgD family transcriptional regulator
LILSGTMTNYGSPPVGGIGSQRHRVSGGVDVSNDVFGLDERAEVVYRMALARRTADPEALSEWLRWPVEQVRAVMATLVDQGLCVSSPDGEDMLRPDQADARRDLRAARQAARLRAALADEIATIRSGALGRYGSGRSRPTTTSGVEVMTDRLKLARLLADLNRRSERQVTFLAPLPEENVGFEAAILDPGLAARKVPLRGVWFEREFTHRRPSPGVLELAAAGGVRTVDAFPMKAVVWDGSFALVPQDPADPASPALLIAQPGLVAIVAEMIDRHWARGTLWTGPRSTKPLTTRHRAVLELLVTGFTDEAISRRLGIGERTVRREVAHLMDALGVSGRVALGAEAVRRKLVQ